MPESPSQPAEKQCLRGQPLHLLTLTPFYPSRENAVNGCFIAEPLPWMERFGMVHTVVAVQPVYRSWVHPGNAEVRAQWSAFISLPGGLGLPASGITVFLRLLPKVRSLHRKHPIHLIHAHSALPCGHAAALLGRRLGIPFVVTVHGLDAFSTNQVRGYAGRWCQRISQNVYRSACRVICVSDKVREQVAQGAGAAARMSVVYNGVDVEKFAPSAENFQCQTILSVGNLIPIKGHNLLLRAFAAVHQMFPLLRCEIIGEGPERGRLSSLATDLGIGSKVQFLGHQSRDEVADAMRRCTLFVLPSRYEGLGCVYLEAMSSGKVVVACRGQGIEEILENGVNGWLIGPDDLSGLTDAFSTLLTDAQRIRQMGIAARQTILRGLTLSSQAASLAGLYRECLR